jgi:hypothetical protein
MVYYCNNKRIDKSGYIYYSLRNVLIKIRTEDKIQEVLL